MSDYVRPLAPSSAQRSLLVEDLWGWPLIVHPHQTRQSGAAIPSLHRLYFPPSTHVPSTTTTPLGPFDHSS